ncbi:MAG: FAD-dependent oxidoreductase [Rhodospirillaceae bacterium]|nr:FAD-dependent oxidoreductase [Rhodospirillaceae bacterium]
MSSEKRLKIAVVGTGVSGLSAAWLLNQNHNVTLYEKEAWIGGHCNTVDVTLDDHGAPRTIPVDTGFIVYNETTYPNLTALFDTLGVKTEYSDMSFSASLNNGGFEYSGNTLWTMLAQKRNLVRPRFWNMVWDIMRFYRECVADAARPENANLTLGEYLLRDGYSEAFLRDHLLPMGSAIWSASLKDMRAYPLTSFVRFFKNHGLLELQDSKRPKWRTVTGGSREYVKKIVAALGNESHGNKVRTSCAVTSITRNPTGVVVTAADGTSETYDHVVMASHSDQSLRLLQDSSAQEQKLLGAIRYERNLAILHTDASVMPKRKRAWASWNYLSESGDCDTRLVCLTYWMNMLQNIDRRFPIFVTLNPHREPKASKVLARFEYDHPIFDKAALEAQKQIWSIQGTNRTWFCGAYFGHGFHEDGLQAGLAVAEALGGARRPWTVADESGRIYLPAASLSDAAA